MTSHSTPSSATVDSAHPADNTESADVNDPTGVEPDVEPTGVEPGPEPTRITEPREELRPVVATAPALQRCADSLAAGTGPVAVDAERASGFRYGQRAFLVQLRRAGAGTWLIDPEPFDDLSAIKDALGSAEWILHAATQDLPCLADLHMHPAALFDTELAARLAGLPRVGLAAVIESLLGYSLAKEHSAADWSTRPLPEPWLRYAALDVELLIELRAELSALLEASGKLRYAHEEFEAVRTAPPSAPRREPWRRTHGVHRIRDGRRLEAVRRLWLEREHLARQRDLAPGRLIPDAALVSAAKAMPRTVPALLATKGFHGRAAKREAPRWLRCIGEAARATELPPLQVPTDGPPPQRVWADKRPESAARLLTARAQIAELGERLAIPAENLLTPDFLRRVAWDPPQPLDEAELARRLRELGARPWQIELTTPEILASFLSPDPLPEKKSRPPNGVSREAPPESGLST